MIYGNGVQQEWRILLGWSADWEQMVMLCDGDWNPTDDWPMTPVHIQRLMLLQPDPAKGHSKITLPENPSEEVKVEVVGA
jgi:hypothetical protein